MAPNEELKTITQMRGVAWLFSLLPPFYAVPAHNNPLHLYNPL